MTWKEFKDYVYGEIKRLGMDDDAMLYYIDTGVYPDSPVESLHVWVTDKGKSLSLVIYGE